MCDLYMVYDITEVVRRLFILVLVSYMLETWGCALVSCLLYLWVYEFVGFAVLWVGCSCFDLLVACYVTAINKMCGV